MTSRRAYCPGALMRRCPSSGRCGFFAASGAPIRLLRRRHARRSSSESTVRRARRRRRARGSVAGSGSIILMTMPWAVEDLPGGSDLVDAHRRGPSVVACSSTSLAQSMATSTSPGRGDATAVLVWMRPWASVAGTRLTLWTPASKASSTRRLALHARGGVRTRRWRARSRFRGVRRTTPRRAAYFWRHLEQVVAQRAARRRRCRADFEMSRRAGRRRQGGRGGRRRFMEGGVDAGRFVAPRRVRSPPGRGVAESWASRARRRVDEEGDGGLMAGRMERCGRVCGPGRSARVGGRSRSASMRGVFRGPAGRARSGAVPCLSRCAIRASAEG